MAWDERHRTLHSQVVADFADAARWRDIGRLAQERTPVALDAAPTLAQRARGSRRIVELRWFLGIDGATPGRKHTAPGG